jgi:hypothetical protein
LFPWIADRDCPINAAGSQKFGGGNIAMQFNSVGMYRAWVREGHEPETAIF